MNDSEPKRRPLTDEEIRSQVLQAYRDSEERRLVTGDVFDAGSMPLVLNMLLRAMRRDDLIKELQELHRCGLETAIDFWEQQLGNPGLNVSTMRLGDQRLRDLRGQLHKLQKSVR